MVDKVKAHEGYAGIKCTRDTIRLLQVIKQYMYSNGSEELHTIHNTSHVYNQPASNETREREISTEFPRPIHGNVTSV